MDDYTLQQELEALAGNAFNPDQETDNEKPEPMSDTIARWHQLFDLSPDEAVECIMDHRHDLTRARVSDVHWEMIRLKKGSEGYDREAYEYELQLQKKKAALPTQMLSAEDPERSSVTYLVELIGPLDSPEKVRQVAQMQELPLVVNGQSLEEGRQVKLCCIDAQAKAALLSWAAGQRGGFEPTILVNPKSLR